MSKVVLLCEEGDYSFIVEDSQQDGICCNYGSGYITLLLFDEVLLESDGQYGAELTFSFPISNNGVSDPYVLPGDCDENGLLEYADVERLRKWLLVKKNQSSTFKCVCEEAFLDFNQVTQTLL